MCLNKSAQPIKFIILFMVISCQGNFVNSVSLAPQEIHSANKWGLTKPQAIFYPSLSQTFNNTVSIHRSRFKHFCTEEKHHTSFFFSLKSHVACT